MTTPIPPARPTFQYQTSPAPCLTTVEAQGCGAGPGEPCVIRPGYPTAAHVGQPRATLHAHRPRVAEQPPPVANDHLAVVDLVVAEMQARKAEGIRRYGVPLQPFNGRDADQDAFEEALDLTFYLRQALEERRALAPLLDELIRAARAVVDGDPLRSVGARARLGAAVGAYARAHAKTGLPPIPDANENYKHR